MVLIDDAGDTVIGPLAASPAGLKKLYDFELMMGSGRLAGYRVEDRGLEKRVLAALQSLAEPSAFAARYGLKPGTPALLYAVGDGNHSLATAKTIWEKTKEAVRDKEAAAGSPLRFALVELVNLHDQALVFEPIHRVLFDLAPGRNLIQDMERHYRGRFRYAEYESAEKVMAMVDRQKGSPHRIGVVTPDGFGAVEVFEPNSNLPVGTLQNFLDAFMEEGRPRVVMSMGPSRSYGWGEKAGGRVSISRRWTRENCSGRSYWTEPCPGRLFPWARPRRSVFIWRRGSSFEATLRPVRVKKTRSRRRSWLDISTRN
jgi:hypothetical protein